MPANQNNPFVFIRKIGRNFVPEFLPASIHKNHCRFLFILNSTHRGPNRRYNRLRIHHHPRSPAISAVIGLPVLALCEITEIKNLNGNVLILYRPTDNRALQVGLNDFGEKGYDREFHIVYNVTLYSTTQKAAPKWAAFLFIY